MLLVNDRASAEDVVQDAFENVTTRAHKLRDSGAGPGYLRTSVVITALGTACNDDPRTPTSLTRC